MFNAARLFMGNAFTDVKKDLNAFNVVNINSCYTYKYPKHQDGRRVSIGYESLLVMRKLLVPLGNKAAKATLKKSNRMLSEHYLIGICD